MTKFNLINPNKTSSGNKVLFYRVYSHLPIFIFPLLMILMVCYLVNSIINATKTSATSLTLTLPNNISLDLNPNSNNGFNESSVRNINVETDGKLGYVFSMKAKKDNKLHNDQNESLLKPISQDYTSTAYRDTNDSNELNSWGIRLSKWNGENNDTYQPMPDAEVLIDELDEITTSTNQYQLAIAAKVDNTIPAGTYANDFVFTATSNSFHYIIVYDLNTGTGGPSSLFQEGDTADDTVRLEADAPIREGYTFKGWCDKDTIDDTCSGNIYQPDDVYPKDGSLSTGDEKLILSAMWSRDMPTTMQDFTPDDCAALTRDNDDNDNDIAITLTDIRDNNQYKIAKLKDGRCWMVENLRLGGSASIKLTSADSDVSSDFNLPASTLGGLQFRSDNTAYVYVPDSDSDEGQKGYGGYYSWYAATAGTGGTRLGYLGRAISSICPKGWRLPIGGERGEFQNLYNQYNSLDLMLNGTPHFLIAGHYIYPSLSMVYYDNEGQYWSSTSYGSNGQIYETYVLNLRDSGSVDPVSEDYQHGGNSVRCILAP